MFWFLCYRGDLGIACSLSKIHIVDKCPIYGLIRVMQIVGLTILNIG